MFVHMQIERPLWTPTIERRFIIYQAAEKTVFISFA